MTSIVLWGPPASPGEDIFREDEFIVCCAFCARMRSLEGQWVSLPVGMSQTLHQTPFSISHTYCPECLARHFPQEARERLT